MDVPPSSGLVVAPFATEPDVKNARWHDCSVADGVQPARWWQLFRTTTVLPVGR
jgi:hypothetical protein